MTEFAPAERVPIAVIERQSASLSESYKANELLHSLLNYVFILNRQRQIVFASRNLHQLISGKDIQSLMGMRPGEALNCLHAKGSPSGCGSTKHCEECGAVQAILASLAGQPCLREVRMTRVIHCVPEAMDLLVYATPFDHNGELFSLLSLTDISHEKRRRAWEHFFFHDVMNYACGLEGLAAQLKAQAPARMAGNLGLLQSLLHDLVDDVLGHKQLVSAENNDLVVSPTAMNSASFLEQLLEVHRAHPTAKGRRLSLASRSASVDFCSDPALLKRVLGNLLNNALEAIPEGQKVTLGCDATARAVRFWVHNPGVMPKKVELQVFERSFSTKGSGRGLGAYGVKLLTEKYLKGKVGFTTSARKGTTFFVTLPRTDFASNK